MRAERTSAVVLAGLAFAGLMPAATAAALEIPLIVEEHGGVAGPRRVTCGVPLLPGQVKDAKDLRLTAGGAPVPAQFRELARWWRADPSTGSGSGGNSVRWVLVDFAAEFGAKEKKELVLTDAKVEAPPTKLAVEQDENSITVVTGPARFVVSKKHFNFLEKAVLDLNGDGKLGDDENLLASTPECGTVLEDTFGQKYFGSEGVTAVEVLESGPMRVCVRARGKHPPHDGKGYSPGMYGYDVFMNFYAGSTDVFADLIVGNNFPKSIGIPAFEDGSLRLRLAGGAKGYRLLGEKASEGALAAGESVCLYQDSNGADTWETCPGLGKMETSGWKRLKGADDASIQFTAFRGFKVSKRAAGKEEELAKGDHARGTLAAWNDRGGVVAHVKNFWQQFPKAAEVSADGTVRLGLWPREWKYPHFIADCSAKGYEIVLHFHGTRAPAGPYARDAAGRPEAGAVADCWDARVFAIPTLAHRAAAGALSDVGPYTPPTKGLDKKPDSRVAIDSPKAFTDDKLYGNAYGWRVFGERWRSQGGHGSRGARQPIDEDNYLWRWYVTGVQEWLAVGDARSRHYRDSRCYRIDDQDALGFPDWAAFRAANTSERREWTNRPQPDNEEIKKYREGLPGYGTNWEFPNPEHCVLDLLYDRYLIFGDVRSLENMRVAAGHGGYFAIAHGPNIGRDTGWSWRTLERYWDLTGDKRAGEMLNQIIAKNAALVGKAPLWHGNNPLGHASDWFTQIWSRAAAMTALHTGDSKMLELCKTLAEDKGSPRDGSVTYGKQSKIDARMFSTLFAVLYHLTGEEKYALAALAGDEKSKDSLADALKKGDGLLSAGGYFPASDHWLLSQPPKAKR